MNQESQTTIHAETRQETTTDAPAKLQAVVDYLPGITIAGAESALLEWSADDRIRFFKMDYTTNQATEVLFDVPVKEVQNVGGSPVMLVLTVNGKKYNAQFSQTGMAKLGVGGAVGVGLSYADSKKSGVDLWVSLFKQHGVPSTFKGWGWSLAVGGGIAAVLFMVVAIYFAISTY